MKSKRRYLVLPIVVLAVMVAGFVAMQPANSFTMDVNPSIEIVTNRLDRVVEINPLNKDAEELLRDFNPRDKNLESTVNDLVDLMILTGHLRGGADNFVMITVDDDTVDSRLVDKVNRAIAAMLQNKQIEATVLNQAIAKGTDDGSQTGVQLAAQRISEMGGSLTAEEIGGMTVTQLIQYSRDNNIAVESLFRVASGEAALSRGESIITREEALSIALGLVDGEVIKIELDDLYDDDDPEYEIKIIKDGVEYEIEIDAYTGRIKEFERDDDDDDYSPRSENFEKQPHESGPRTRITADQAKKIALDLVGGGVITEFEADDDEFEIEIKFKGKEYEVEIDPYSGRILDFEVEDDD